MHTYSTCPPITVRPSSFSILQTVVAPFKIVLYDQAAFPYCILQTVVAPFKIDSLAAPLVVPACSVLVFAQWLHLLLRVSTHVLFVLLETGRAPVTFGLFCASMYVLAAVWLSPESGPTLHLHGFETFRSFYRHVPRSCNSGRLGGVGGGAGESFRNGLFFYDKKN